MVVVGGRGGRWPCQWWWSAAVAVGGRGVVGGRGGVVGGRGGWWPWLWAAARVGGGRRHCSLCEKR